MEIVAFLPDIVQRGKEKSEMSAGMGIVEWGIGRRELRNSIILQAFLHLLTEEPDFKFNIEAMIMMTVPSHWQGVEISPMVIVAMATAKIGVK